MPDWLSYLWYEVGYWASVFTYTFGYSFRFEGSRHVPKKGPALIVANHQSFFDPTAIGVAARRHLYYLARKTLFDNRIFGAYLRSVNVIPVDQEGVAKEGLKAILDQLKAGHAVLIFPEGERTWKGEVQPLKPGIQLLIRKSDAPIVPVGIAGSFNAWPRSRKLPLLCPPFLPANEAALAVSIGRPLDPRLLRELPKERLLSDLRAAIVAAKERAERLRRKPS
jgi:1-acyl-sn-glycerol-3-phosphate acyltransferase